MIYYPFNATGNYRGDYQPYSTTPITSIDGDITQPSDIVKLNESNITNVWDQIPESLTFLGTELIIESCVESDITPTIKSNYIESYLRYIGIYNYLNNSYITELSLLFDDQFFNDLSSPSIAYCTRSDGVYGTNYDFPYYTSNEVSIGLNTYIFNVIKDYVTVLPNGNDLKDIIYQYHIQDARISNLCKVSYKGFTNIVWCFGGIEYKLYDTSNIGITPSLKVGGGNWFSEVKLGADRIQARYIVKKNVDEEDPTYGLASGDPKPFCIGDKLILVDTTSLSDYNSTTGWTWFNGDYDSQIFYTWNLADVSGNVCDTYKNIPIDDLLLPIRIIMFCRFNEFN